MGPVNFTSTHRDGSKLAPFVPRPLIRIVIPPMACPLGEAVGNGKPVE